VGIKQSEKPSQKELILISEKFSQLIFIIYPIYGRLKISFYAEKNTLRELIKCIPEWKRV